MWKIISATVLTVAVLISAALPAAAQKSDVTLRVAIQGGEFQRVQNKYAAERFTALTGIKIEWVAGNPTDHLQKMIASRGRPAPFDVVYLDDKLQPQAIEAGTVLKLDNSLVPNLALLYPQAKQKEGYGPAMLFWAWGLFYNVDAFQKAGISAPQSWTDLWNPKLAGKVAVFDVGASGGVDFILKIAELNGGGVDDLQPGLDKIAQLKVQSYLTSANTASASLTAGDIWVVPFNNGRTWGMIDAGFPGKFFIPKEGGYSHTTTIDVVATTKYPTEAQAFINYVLDPVSQLGQSFEIPYAPVNTSLAGVLQAYPEIAKKFPTPGGEMMKQLTVPDWNAVFAKYPELVDRWNRTVKAH